MTGRITSRVVIALPGSERLTGFMAQPGAESFEVFEAFDGRQGAVPPFFDVGAFESRYGVPARGGEIGCAASHYLAIEAFARGPGQDSDLLLVCEDDARWTAVFWRTMRRIEAAPLRLTYVVLADGLGAPNGRSLYSLSEKHARLSLLVWPVGWCAGTFRRLGYVGGTVWGAGCYLINRACARRYVEWVGRSGLSWKADDYDVWSNEVGVRILLVRPGLCSWEGETTIGSPTFLVRQDPRHETHGGLVTRVRTRLALGTRLRRLREAARVTCQDLAHRRRPAGGGHS